MERGRKIVIWGIGICVTLLLAFVLIIALISNKDKKKKPDDGQTEDSSVEIPKYLLSEIHNWDKSRNEAGVTVLFEYDEIGRWSRVTCRYSEDDSEQLVYEFSYRYENGEPFTVVSLSGIYEVLTTTKTYDSSGILREEETTYEDPDEPGREVVVETVRYDEKGNETLKIEYDFSGSVASKEEIEYDAYGKYVKWVRTRYEDGYETVTEHLKSECDEKGRVVRYIDPDTNALSMEFQYLDDGSRIEVDYAWDGRKNREYFYDSEGRLVKHIIYDEGEIGRTLEYEYTPTEYGYMETETLTDYPEGEVKKQDTEYDSKGKMIYQKDYSFGEEFYVVRDDTGRIISEERKSSDGNVWYKLTYEYDEEGKLISEDDRDTLTTFRYVPVSLTAEQAKERAKFYLDEKLYQWYY
ncbi:MAG: hypothetical protein J5649_06145 [Lachnospiraceae bacterium]|nr:hypothetical protein [Lachnospiraceae bacterium]